MLNRTKIFFKTTLLGGVIVILPAIILILAFKWLFGVVGGAIEPLTSFAEDQLPLGKYNEFIAPVIVISVIVLGCFIFGLFVRTKLGQMIYNSFENSLLSK